MHSSRSFCSRDPEQTPEKLIAAAKADGFTEICVTDHFWDEAVPGIEGLELEQNYANLSANLPLPKDDEVTLHFGCETDLDSRFVLGIAPEHYDWFELILVSPSHMHLTGFTVQEDLTLAQRSVLYYERNEAIFQMDLPFYKVGLTHFTTGHLVRGAGFSGKYPHLDVIDGISDSALYDLFHTVAQKRAGVELNFEMSYYDNERDLERSLRPYYIAKDCGCRFYFGSDAHHPRSFLNRRACFEAIVEKLDLQESEKFRPFLKGKGL